MIALLVVACGVASAAPKSDFFQRGCRDRSCWMHTAGRGGGGAPLGPPLFSFAPTGTACSGAAVTGTKGEVVTFTRASTRTCLKGNETTGIAVGDMVTLSANQPAVQPGGDGTGPLGLSMWGSRKNQTDHSEQFDNARWVKNGGSTLAVATADFGLSPRNTLTADRLLFGATDGVATSSFVYEDSSCEAGVDTFSVFVRGTPDGGLMTGQLDLAVNDGANGWYTTTCNWTSASWSRCSLEQFNENATGINMLVAIGNLTTNGGLTHPASDLLVWGAQCEIGVQASPYIATAAAAVTRAAELATTPYTATGASVGLGGTYTALSRTDDNTPIVSMSFAATDETTLDVIGAKDRCDFGIASAHTMLNGPQQFVVASNSGAASCHYALSVRSACSGNSCKNASGALTLPSGAATLYLGAKFDGGVANGTVKNICADPSAGKCVAGQSTLFCPTDEPHKVATIGDSIMVGAFDIRVVDELNDKLCPRGFAADAFAVSGAAIDGHPTAPIDCVTQYHNSIKGHAYRAVLTNCGTNNLASSGDPEVAWAMMESLLNDITRDGGFHAIVSNVLPCHGSSACIGTTDTGIITFNAHEADWCADAGSRATCLDDYTVMGVGSRTFLYSNTANNTSLGNLCLPSSDSRHPNNFCTTKYADTFADAVQ